MKKIYFSMMAIAIAAFTFTACEDVPEPYNNPYDQLKNNTGGETGSLPYTSEALNTGWSLQSVTADQPWITGSNYAQATGYQKWDGASAKSNKAVEGWLVSPAISTVGFENVKLSFDNTIKYTNNVTGWADNHKIYASTSFDGTNASADTWTELSFTPVASTYSDWTLYSSGEIQLPAEFVGKETVYIGFWFKAPASGSTTWELKNFKMEEGVAGENGGNNEGGNENPETPITGDNLLTNGDFETWTNGQPDNWKSTNTASSATLSQSTEAHGGSYSVKVAHDANGNKRLAYKELKLKAGSYGVSFFVKASEATASINPGYTTVTDKVNYNYNGYVNDITTEWQQVSYNFTLSAETEVNLVVMVPKNSAADAIIDDFTLVTSDGGIVDGNDTPATPDTPDTDAIFSESFANGQGNFTIDDKVLSGIWTAGSYGSDKYMMATSYIKLDGESAKANHDAESWLVSPEIDLTNATSAVLKFSEVINSYFGNVNDEAKVYVKAENGEWTALSFTRAEKPSKGYTKFTDATANISIDLNAYKGGKMQFAFVYKGTATAAGTWEVKDIKIVPAAQ